MFEISELRQALHWYERRNAPLAVDPSTNDELLEICDALNRVGSWLDDGFHDQLVVPLKLICGDIHLDRNP